MDIKHLATNLVSHRELAGLNRSELAERARVSVSYISRLEKAQIKRPSYDYLVQIAHALDMPVDLLTDSPGYGVKETPDGHLVYVRPSQIRAARKARQERANTLAEIAAKLVDLAVAEMKASRWADEGEEAIFNKLNGPDLGIAAAADPHGGTDIGHLEDRDVVEFTIGVEGDCLAPEIEPGDRVLLRRGVQPQSGQIAWLRINGEMHLKRVVARNGQWVLETKDGPISMPAEEIICEAVVVDVLVSKR